MPLLPSVGLELAALDTYRWFCSDNHLLSISFHSEYLNDGCLDLMMCASKLYSMRKGPGFPFESGAWERASRHD